MHPHDDSRKLSPAPSPAPSRAPSPTQLAAIEAPGGDVIVLAGAGAGKTTTLVARLMHLLARRAPTASRDPAGEPAGHRLRAIAAITFTEKAARELRSRLRQAVTQQLADPTHTPADHAYWQAIGDDLDGARIGTIHSLCAEILRSHPEAAHIDPRFGVLDEAAALLATQDAVDAAVAWANTDPAASVLFRWFDPEALRTLLADLLANRLKVKPLLDQELWTAWPGRSLAAVAAAFLAVPAVREAMSVIEELDATGALAAAAGKDKLAANLVQALAAWRAAQAAAARSDLPGLCTALASLRSYLALNVGAEKNWPAGQFPKPWVRQLQTQYKATLEPLLKDVDPALDAELAALLAQVRRLFDQALAAYDRAKRERAALDFDDLEQKALDLLAQPAVRARWQAEIDALLVDEFQDTNGRQRDLVQHIASDRGCLFVVGDAKQSIYRFRGAQVHVFFQVLDEIRARRGTVVELAASYRTHAALLEALNALMASVLAAGDAPGPWRAPFAPLTPERHACDHGLAAPYVELHLAAGTKGEGALETAAQALAARLAQLKHASGGRLDYGDVAILCRGSGSFPAYEAALEEAGIPYVTVAGRGFYDRPEIRDLRTTLQALADPTNDLALAGLLRSAAVGLSDADLFDLRFGSDGALRPLWPALQAAAQQAGAQPAAAQPAGAQQPGVHDRLVRAAHLVATHHAQAGRSGVAGLLKRWLDATDYLAVLAAAGNARAERNVAKLLDDAHRSGLVDVAEFLEFVSSVRDVGGREGEARGDDVGAVQIMTVHKAKGLEFPVVVIGDAGSRGASGRSRLLVDDDLGVVLKLADDAGRTPLVWALAQATDEDQEAAEIARLFYVAATRSADKLIVSGTVSVDKHGGCGEGDGWLKQLLAALTAQTLPATVEPAGTAVHPLHGTLGGQTVGGAVYELKWRPDAQPTPGAPAAAGQAADRATPAHQPGASWTAAMVMAVDGYGDGATTTHQEEAGRAGAGQREPARLVWRVVPDVAQPGAPAWLVGNLVHEALAAWHLPVDGGLEAWVRARARTYGLSDDASLRAAVVKVRTLLRRFQDSPLYAEIAGAERRLHELPYTWLPAAAAGDDRTETGVIDLLFCRDGGWTLVDFKTDRIRTPDQRALVLDGGDYRQQVRRYAAAVAGLAGAATGDVRVLICLLDDRGKVSEEPVSIESLPVR